MRLSLYTTADSDKSLSFDFLGISVLFTAAFGAWFSSRNQPIVTCTPQHHTSPKTRIPPLLLSVDFTETLTPSLNMN